MASRLDMIVRFARHIERDARDTFGLRDVKVTAEVEASLNGREYQQLIDPKVDLTEVQAPPFTTADYIEPLRTPLN